MARIVFINSPFAFRAIWGIVTPFLHKITLDKTRIVGSGTAILKEFAACGIPLRSVPVCYGGEHEGVAIKELIEGWRGEAAVIGGVESLKVEEGAVEGV